MKVPFLDLQTPNRQTWEKIGAKIQSAFENAGFIGGPEVAAFEEEFARFSDVAECASVANGTEALRLALVAAGIKPGHEVITPPNTFIATTEAISQAGGKPVFADIDPLSYNLDPKLAESALSSRTRFIVPVHLYGQCADMDPINALADRHNLTVIEDAAQAQGSRYKGRSAGSLGKAAGFSFYPGKNLGAAGEAGAVTSNDARIIADIKMLRDHGQRTKYYHDVEGCNARMDALQAIVLRAKLEELADQNKARRICAGYYDELLSGAPEIVVPKVMPDCEHIYHLYVVQVPKRDKVQSALNEAGISTGLHYPLPLHQQKAYAGLGYKTGQFPVTEAVAARLLSLPMFPTLTSEQQEYVAENLIRAVHAAA